MGEVNNALHHHTRALAMLERCSPGDAQMPFFMANKGRALMLAKPPRLEEALTTLDAALALLEAGGIGENIEIVASILNSKAVICVKIGRLSLVEPLQQRIVEMQERVLGPSSYQTVCSRFNLTVTRLSKGLHRESLAPLRTMHAELSQMGLSTDHETLLGVKGTLANCLTSLGKYGEALSLFEQALAGQLQRVGPNHAAFGCVKRDVSKALLSVGRLKEAEAALKDAVRVFTHVRTSRAFWT